MGGPLNRIKTILLSNEKKKALLYNLVVRGHRLSFHSVHWFQETENCECIIIRLTPDSFWILHNKGKWFTCKTKHFEDSIEFSYMKMQFVTLHSDSKHLNFDWILASVSHETIYFKNSCMRCFTNWVTFTCRFNGQRPLFQNQKQIYFVTFPAFLFYVRWFCRQTESCLEAALTSLHIKIENRICRKVVYFLQNTLTPPRRSIKKGNACTKWVTAKW